MSQFASAAHEASLDLSDPYPYYRLLREEDPIHWDPSLGTWVVTRYRHVANALVDERLSAQPDLSSISALPAEVEAEAVRLRRHFERWMLFSDPPDHTRRRSVIHRVVTPQVAAALRPRIETVANGLLNHAEERGWLDIVEDYAIPLARAGLASLIGVEEIHLGRATTWADNLLDFIMTEPDADLSRRTGDVLVELHRLVRSLATFPVLRSDSLGAALIAAIDAGTLDEEEAVATVAQALTGSLGALTHLLANGVLGLAIHPEQAQLLRNRPLLVRGAVEEVLRFDCPFLLVPRLAKEDLQLGDVEIGSGDRVWLILAAANHDPDHFREPERMNVLRRNVRHLAFGRGDHYCPGASLARVVAQVGITALLSRFDLIEIDQVPVTRLARLGMRGLASLRVRLGRTAGILSKGGIQIGDTSRSG